jgi:bifunctional non-homologous end joining protein LigD
MASALTYRDLALMTPAKAAFTRAGWVFEIKYDGFRTLALREGEDVRIVSRRGTNMTPCYPEVGTALRDLPDVALDGELVILDSSGHPQFDRLRRRLALSKAIAIAHAARHEPATLMAFDLLMLDGKDMRGLPLLKRKAALKKLLRDGERIRYVEHIGEEGVRIFQQAEKLGLEGIVAKRGDAPYRRGRSPDWMKIKTSAGRAIDEQRSKWMEPR